jgi:hypothetical protein
MRARGVLSWATPLTLIIISDTRCTIEPPTCHSRCATSRLGSRCMLLLQTAVRDLLAKRSRPRVHLHD